jgi:basic amino acid/polyamine antiporter, APA family
MNETEQGSRSGGLGLWDAISIIVGIVIGTTIFKIPWLIFANASDPLMGLLVWVAGGALALVGALCYAELATTYPRSGGDYAYLTQAFGRWTGFLFGWAQLVVILTASIGTMAYVFGDFATSLKNLREEVDIGVSSELMYAFLAVIVLSLLNIVGVTLGKYAQNLLTLAKIIGLMAILVAGFGWPESNPIDWRFEERAPLGWGTLAMILVLYAYGGWNDAAFVAAEVRDQKRNIPRALIFGVGLITVIYLLVNMAYITGLGFETARQFGRLPEMLLKKPFGDFGGKAMSILVMISALGAVNGLIFTGSRVYATMGNDHWLFGWLGHWKPGRGAPILALLAQALITLGMLFTFGTKEGHDAIDQILGHIGLQPEGQWNPDSAFETLVSHTAPVFWIFFLMTGLSLFILREKNPTLPRPFSVPFYPVLPIIFCNMCVYMLYQSTIYVGWRALIAVGLILLGLPLYWLSRMMDRTPESNQ